MRKLISAILGVLTFGLVYADDHGSNWLVEIGEGVSQSSHLCSLKGKATLADVDKIDAKLHKWHDDNGKLHTFHIPNSYYVPSSTIRLF